MRSDLRVSGAGDESVRLVKEGQAKSGQNLWVRDGPCWRSKAKIKECL